MLLPAFSHKESLKDAEWRVACLVEVLCKLLRKISPSFMKAHTHTVWELCVKSFVYKFMKSIRRRSGASKGKAPVQRFCACVFVFELLVLQAATK